MIEVGDYCYCRWCRNHPEMAVIDPDSRPCVVRVLALHDPEWADNIGSMDVGPVTVEGVWDPVRVCHVDGQWRCGCNIDDLEKVSDVDLVQYLL